MVRQQLPDLLRAGAAQLSQALGVALDDFGVEGLDGTGLKSEIPWVRVFGREQSLSSTTERYVVYLFSAPGQRVYLSLNQGTTIDRAADPFVTASNENPLPEADQTSTMPTSISGRSGGKKCQKT